MRAIRLVLAVCVALVWSFPAFAQASPPRAAEGKPEGVDAERIFNAIVKVSMHAIPNARSSATLGSEREGTGVVIGDNGLILTIGYLIVEADDVSILDNKGRTFSARVVGYDHATGFGLLRTIAPIDAKPVTSWRFGQGRRARPGDDRLVGRRQRRLRLHRQQALVLRQLGVRPRAGAVHEPAHAQLERRRALRPRRQAARRGLADRARSQRRRAQDPGQHVRPDRSFEADSLRSRCRPGAAPDPRGPGSASLPTKCRDGWS